MTWKNILLFLLLFLYIKFSSAQNNDFVNFIKSLKMTKIQDKINDIKQDLFTKNIDTNCIIFIPVFNSNLCVKNLNDEYVYMDNSLLSKQFLSEILFIRKSDKKVIGSYYFCTNGNGFTHFYESSFGYLSTTPCRYENRLTWLSENFYRSIKKLLRKQKNIGIFITLNNIGGLVYIKDNESVEIIYPDKH